MNEVRNCDELMRRLDAMAEEITGKKPDPDAEASRKAQAYNTAFWEAMHTGMPQNALKEGSDGAGGYLVPDTYEDRLVSALARRNVLRQIGTTLPTTQKLHIPVSNGVDGADWVVEGQPYACGEAQFGEVVLDAYKLGTSILVSDEMLEDGGVDLEAYIQAAFAERIGSEEESAFIRGDGKGKPLGLIRQASVGAVSEMEGDICVDDLMDLQHSVNRVYRKNAVWLLSEDANRILHRINHYNGRPLWKKNLSDGEPEYLLGHRIYVCKALDDVVPGGIPAMFGDFRYFWIGDRGKRVFKRLVEHYANRGMVAFLTSERVDARLVLPDAVKMLKVSGTPAANAEE